MANEFVSSIDPKEDVVDKYLLYNPETGEHYACRFFFWDLGFKGASLLAMYKLNEFFDMTLIDKDFNNKTVEEYFGI